MLATTGAESDQTRMEKENKDACRLIKQNAIKKNFKKLNWDLKGEYWSSAEYVQ